MKFHIPKSEMKWKSREDEFSLIYKLFFKRNGEKKIISNFKKYFKDLDEHQILVNLSKNIYTKHYNYLLFYHWYERKYNINIIENFSNSILETPITDNSIITSLYTRNKKLESELRDLVIHNISSSRFNGFSVFYEYFYDFFPNIEQFSLEDFIGDKFLKYLIELNPHIYQISHDNGSYYRFEDNSLPNPKHLFDSEYGNDIIRYNRGLPCYYPRIPDKQNILHHTHYPLNLMKRSVKELEDIVRESKGLPKIGEGWISETTLYYELKNHFKNEEVVHHGQPNWLGLQHIDIWFPKHKIGIEYQGLQHDEPIDFFGGEESFIKNQNRDKRKKKLFQENDSLLIEVRPDYVLDDVIKKIKINLSPFQ